MYCSNCGKHNPEGSKYCQNCGTKLFKPPVEVSDLNSSDKGIVENKKEKINAGLGGWLALVGLGLIYTVFTKGSVALSSIPMLSETYAIADYSTLIMFEFLGAAAMSLAGAYLLYLYFKKNRNFPEYFIMFLVSNVIFVVVDHLFLSSLTPITADQQKLITDALSQHNDVITNTVVFAVIWILYMKKSKRVQATFVKNN